jgi:hypothetical protein
VDLTVSHIVQPFLSFFLFLRGESSVDFGFEEDLGLHRDMILTSMVVDALWGCSSLLLFGIGLELGTHTRAGIRTGIDMSNLSGLDMGHGILNLI